jgi:Icc-related predicted phosphoesterase
MKILSLSDVCVPFIYSPSVKNRFKDIDLILGCGDVPYYYLEYVFTALRAPLIFVRGNHDKEVEFSTAGKRTSPQGGFDLHRRVINHDEFSFAGVEGSIRYKPGRFQYSQEEMWLNVFHIIPSLVFNRAKSGRFLDIFITHAPPKGIHDCNDHPHKGITAFRWFDLVFKPTFHFHGHTHLYRPDDPVETILGNTRVVNTFRFQETKINLHD